MRILVTYQMYKPSWKEYDKLYGTDFTWIFYKCSCPNFSNSFFADLLESKNPFSALTSTNEDEYTWQDTIS